jgi:hypothetical protein
MERKTNSRKEAWEDLVNYGGDFESVCQYEDPSAINDLILTYGERGNISDELMLETVLNSNSADELRGRLDCLDAQYSSERRDERTTIQYGSIFEPVPSRGRGGFSPRLLHDESLEGSWGNTVRAYEGE